MNPGQESVWDCPPRLEETDGRIKVVCGGLTLAYTMRARQELETSPLPEDVRMEHLTPSFCEWRGRAQEGDFYGGWITAGPRGW
jgi:uncharacterized protein (DUF427 family)